MWIFGLILFCLGAFAMIFILVAATQLVNLAFVVAAIFASGLLISGAVFIGCAAIRDQLLSPKERSRKQDGIPPSPPTPIPGSRKPSND